MNKADRLNRVIFNVLDGEGGSKGTFNRYEDKKVLGEWIKQDLLTKMIEDGEGRRLFYMGYREEYSGLLAQCYGLTSLLLLKNAYGCDFSAEEDRLILDSLRYIFRHLDEYGYDLDPFIESRYTAALLKSGEEGYQYIDSLSWVLSVMVHVRYAYRKGRLSVPEDLMDEIVKRTRYILNYTLENIIGGEDEPSGWGYFNECGEASIYFTYAMLEAWNDFDDYILGNKEIEELQKNDEEFLERINEGRERNFFQRQISRIKRRLGLYYWEKYKNILNVSFFNESGEVIDKNQIRNSSRSSVLFNTIYVICILIYCEADIQPETSTEQVRLICTQAIQMVSNFYDILKNEGLGDIVNTYIVSFEQEHEKKKELASYFASTTVQATTLTPMLLKANSLLTFYITKYPEREMARQFSSALERCIGDEDKWLWEDSKYDLIITERYIESILDFYDYYESFVELYVNKVTDEERRTNEIKERYEEELKRRAAEGLEEEWQERLRTREREIRAEYAFENAITDKIRREIKNNFLEVVRERLESLYEGIVGDDKGNSRLSREDKEINELLLLGMKIILAGYVNKAWKDRYLNADTRTIAEELIDGELTNSMASDFIEQVTGEISKTK